MIHHMLADDGETVITTENTLEWTRWFEHADRVVKHDCLDNGICVSTIFTGIDYSFGMGPPILWETMTLGSPESWLSRYPTRELAVTGHVALVAQLRPRHDDGAEDPRQQPGADPVEPARAGGQRDAEEDRADDQQGEN